MASGIIEFSRDEMTNCKFNLLTAPKECFMSEFKVNTVCADALGDSDATALAERLEKGEVRTCK